MINQELIKDFNVVHFSELPDSMLINRVDSKYFFNSKLVDTLFQLLKDGYQIIDYGHGLINDYYTIYYDTEDLQFYIAHHNKQNHRLKVRNRTYVNSELNYFEIKHKINGRTLKDRNKIMISEVGSKLEEFSISQLNNKKPIFEKLITKFNRITFVDNCKSERVTLDFDLQFSKDKKSKKMSNLIVLELKQDGINRNSKIFNILKTLNIRKSKFSKYFVGMNLLNDNIKNNNFKPIKLKLEKQNIGVINA